MESLSPHKRQFLWVLDGIHACGGLPLFYSNIINIPVDYFFAYICLYPLSPYIYVKKKKTSIDSVVVTLSWLRCSYEAKKG